MHHLLVAEKFGSHVGQFLATLSAYQSATTGTKPSVKLLGELAYEAYLQAGCCHPRLERWASFEELFPAVAGAADDLSRAVTRVYDGRDRSSGAEESTPWAEELGGKLAALREALADASRGRTGDDAAGIIPGSGKPTRKVVREPEVEERDAYIYT